MMHERVAVTFVREAISKRLSLVKGMVPYGMFWLVKYPNGLVQILWVPLATLKTPPIKAPLNWQQLILSSTDVQSYSWQLAIDMSKINSANLIGLQLLLGGYDKKSHEGFVILLQELIKIWRYLRFDICCGVLTVDIFLSLKQVLFSINNSYPMKALSNSQNEIHYEESQQPILTKKLAELQHINKEKELIIQKYERQIKSLEEQNQTLDEQLDSHEKEWKQLEVQLEEGKDQPEEEQEMHNWMENVQKYNGLPQEAIDSLCTMEFQGEQEICLSCYQELSSGTMCTYLPCSHLFHKECIGNHLKISKWCPACQEIVNP